MIEHENAENSHVKSREPVAIHGQVQDGYRRGPAPWWQSLWSKIQGGGAMRRWAPAV